MAQPGRDHRGRHADRQFGPDQPAQRRVANLGNIQFRRSAKKITEAVGSETFDPAQAGRAGDMYGTDIEDWKNEFGKYLKDLPAAKVQLFACMSHGINEIDHIYGAGTCEWRNKEAEALYDGYAKAVAKLKQQMKLERPKLMKLGSSAPKGMMLKLNWLGWL